MLLTLIRCCTFLISSGLAPGMQADIKVADDGIELVVQGGPASVQPTRRGRGAGGRGGVSSLLWPDGFTWALTVRLTDVESLSQLSEPPVSAASLAHALYPSCSSSEWLPASSALC